MSDVAIRVENLGKQYRIGPRQRYKTIRESLMAAFSSPIRRLRQADRRSPHTPCADKAPIICSPGVSGRDQWIWALKDACFEIKRGEVIGIIGRNGAGKSTLLKILSRITKPTVGQAEIHGRVGSLLEVGTGFHPELTGRENTYLNGAILGMRKAEIDRKFDEIVAFAEVERFIDTPVKHYSSGMYVRLAFAVAAHLELEILLVDEVLAVGDGAFQKKCLGKMGGVAREGRTILLVSHNMTAIRALCSSVLYLERGKQKALGMTDTVVSMYSGDIMSSQRLAGRSWDSPQTAPGNEKIRLHRVQVTSCAPGGATALDTATPFMIAIEFWNCVQDQCAIINLCLYGIDDTPVLESLSVNEAAWNPRPLPPGLLRSVCYIPPHLLNEGTYRVRVLFIDSSAAKLFDYPDAALFTLAGEQRGMPWHGRFMGGVHPVLEWTTSTSQLSSSTGC